MKWRAHGAYARGAFRRAEETKRAFDRIVAQRFEKCCATARSDMHFAASARRKSPRTQTPCAHHEMVYAKRVRAWRISPR
eukprot:6511327-Lingulodinium_polyedra.AAC.1